ncbi:hypothetical protein P9293_21530 [Bacillus inaquosorum]|uniref:hypothetical protein n=1 Tax=Bacillus inaquosorum TaxID=483913 RepID=UPI0002DA015E|nr:hypothetical protein [Bacillus inaquosorum]MED4649916.1 hypothetical protein [Bacillus inaquosorum]MED4793349.1 hypothetical protein [Bacillus inaquosorum]
MIRIYETGDSQFNNLAAAWSKMTHLDKDLFEVSAIILASDHQEKEAKKVAAALKGNQQHRERKNSSLLCLLSWFVCYLKYKR